MADAETDRRTGEAPVGDDEAVTTGAADGRDGGRAAGRTDAPGEALEETEQRPVTITGSQVSGLRATRVEIRDSMVESVDAERVDLTDSRAGRVDGRLVQMEGSRAIRVEGKRVVAQGSSIGGLIAEQARFVRSRVLISVSRNTELGTDSRIFVHVGPLPATVRPVVTARTAAAFGAGAGLALAAGFRLFGRRS